MSCLAVLLLIGGCATSDEPPADDGRAVMQPVVADEAEPDEVRVSYALLIYDVATPAGELSNNPQLWKALDEQAVDVATYDLLYKNGVRVAVGAAPQLEDVRQYIDDPDAKQVSISDLEDRSTYLPMREADRQTIIYFDDQNELIGRQFDAFDPKHAALKDRLKARFDKHRKLLA